MTDARLPDDAPEPTADDRAALRDLLLSVAASVEDAREEVERARRRRKRVEPFFRHLASLDADDLRKLARGLADESVEFEMQEASVTVRFTVYREDEDVATVDVAGVVPSHALGEPLSLSEVIAEGATVERVEIEEDVSLEDGLEGLIGDES